MVKPGSLTLVALATPLMFASCASVIQGKTDPVTFATVQPGASVEVDGQQHKTPATVEVLKKTTTATFSRPGQAPAKVEWKRDFQKDYVALNVIFTPGWGASGIAADTASGAIYRQPKTVTYDFKTKQLALEKVKPEKTAEDKAKEPKRRGRP